MIGTLLIGRVYGLLPLVGMSESLYESAPNLEKREWLALAAVAALCGVAFFFLLGGVPLLGKDEPRYAQVAREMYQTGDWITPRLAGHAWFEKPALPYWLMAAAYAVMGVGEFAARIGAAAAATVGVFLVYGAARRAGGPSQAAVSAVMLATSPLWFAFARGAGFDMPLAVTITGALAAVYVYDTTDSARGRIRWAALAGVWAGGSMLAKGLVGPLLLVLIVAPYLLVAGSWRRVRYTHLAVALGAAAAVAAVWYVPVTARNGWPFIQEFFINHHFQRYLTNKYHHPQPFYFYPLVVLAGLLPWTPVVLARIGELWSALRRRGADGPDRLLLLAALWVVMPVLFFSASTSKLPGYILPVFPGLALLAGWAAVRIDVSGRGRWSLCAIALVVAGLGIGMAAYAGRALGAPAWESALVAGLALASGHANLVAAQGGDSSSWSSVTQPEGKKRPPSKTPAAKDKTERAQPKSAIPAKTIKAVPQGERIPVVSPPPKAAKPQPAENDAAYEAFDQGLYITAFNLALKAAEKGDPQAHTLIGRMYADGTGTAKNVKLGAEWFARGAELGDAEAQFALGTLLAEGDGVPKDRVAAGNMFEAAAAQRHPAANYNLALLYLRGDGKPENPYRAVAHMRYAAEQGVVNAQYDLGTLYATGTGVDADAFEAAKWMGKAAESGHPEAQLDYAIMLMRGQGVAFDAKKGAQMFKASAERGVAPAQLRLARCYAQGVGVDKSEAEAAKWYLVAKMSGVEDAPLEKLVAALPAAERNKALAAAEAWVQQLQLGGWGE